MTLEPQRDKSRVSKSAPIHMPCIWVLKYVEHSVNVCNYCMSAWVYSLVVENSLNLHGALDLIPNTTNK